MSPLYLFLDIQGVLSNQESFKIWHGYLKDKPNHEAILDAVSRKRLPSVNDVKTFNARKDLDIGIFSNHEGHFGEIVDKRITKMLSDKLNSFDCEVKVILISSANHVLLDHDTELNYEYYSDLWGMNIIAASKYNGDFEDRYTGMYKWLEENIDITEPFSAIMVDDMNTYGKYLDRLDLPGHVKVSHSVESLDTFLDNVSKAYHANEINHETFNRLAAEHI